MHSFGFRWKAETRLPGMSKLWSDLPNKGIRLRPFFRIRLPGSETSFAEVGANQKAGNYAQRFRNNVPSCIFTSLSVFGRFHSVTKTSSRFLELRTLFRP